MKLLFEILLSLCAWHNQIASTNRTILSYRTYHLSTLINAEFGNLVQGVSSLVEVALSVKIVHSRDPSFSSLFNFPAFQTTSTSIATCPLLSTCEHTDVYAMSTFHVLFLQWLIGLSDQVPCLRPILSHALLGLFPSSSSSSSSSGDALNSSLSEPTDSLYLPIRNYGELAQPDSLIGIMLRRHCLSWRGAFTARTFVVFRELVPKTSSH